MYRQTLVIGLTGQTGAGKSTISKMFRDHNVPVIDADIVARDAIENSIGCLTDLVLEFSTEVIDKGGKLNRKRLGQICFGDREKLKRLNEITFPYIIRMILEMIDAEKRRGAPVVVLDAPTLYESGLDKKCDRIIAVVADPELRAKRVISRDRISRDDAMQRIQAQSDDSFYTKRADYVIKNDRGFDDLRMEFIKIYGDLEQLAQSGETALPPEPVQELPARNDPLAEIQEQLADDPGAFEELITDEE